jgi:8-oxo-dGTP pyrophosphatase MutT (NUDIX family)
MKEGPSPPCRNGDLGQFRARLGFQRVAKGKSAPHLWGSCAAIRSFPIHLASPSRAPVSTYHRNMRPIWPALQAARRQNRVRVEFRVDEVRVGSVARDHLAALTAWPGWLSFGDDVLRLVAPAQEREGALATMNRQLHAQGFIRAWRDETFPLLNPADGDTLAMVERASCRFWGSLTRGAHCNGYVEDTNGLPTHLWVARRAWNKATDPGKRDNLVGGGVPFGQTPLETLLREGWEEAGLTRQVMQQATPGRIIRVDCDVLEGRMVEDIHVFDLALPPELRPENQDGEVAEFTLMTLAEAADCAAAGEMTTDAALVTLDFLLRRCVLHTDAGLASALQLSAQLESLLRPA